MKANKDPRFQLALGVVRKSVIFFLVICFFNGTVFGYTKAQIALLKSFQKEEPDLMKRVKIVEEDGKHLAKIALSDILYLAMTRSITLRTSKMAEEAAAKQLLLAQEVYQPYLVTTFQQVKTGALYKTSFSSSPYMTTTDTSATVINTAWQKKTTNGITYSVSFTSTTSKTDTYTSASKSADLTKASSGDQNQQADLTASVSIPVFQDWGDINNIYSNRAQLAVDQADLATVQTGASLLEMVAKTYWTLVGLRSNIKTLEEAANLAQRLVDETKARVEVGILNQTDLKEATIQLATTRQNLFSAKIAEQEIEDQIRAALNLQNLPFGLIPADEPKVHNETLDFDKLLDKVFENDPSLKQLGVAVRSNQFDLNEAMNKDKTNLDVTVGYTFLGAGADLSEAFSKISQGPLQGYQLGVTWTVPLFDKITPEKITKAKIERSYIDLQIEDLKSQLTINLQTIIRNIQFGIEEVKNAELSRSLAKELMEKETEKMRIGKSTAYNVAQSQQKYTSAKYAETMVQVKNEQNYVSLLSLTGDLYSEYSVYFRN